MELKKEDLLLQEDKNFYFKPIFKAQMVNPKILFFNIDDFRKYNFEYGHEKGDLILDKINNLISGYIYWRISGNEWVVIVDDNENDTSSNINFLIKNLQEIKEVPFTIIVSDFDELLRFDFLDEFMYLCKRNNYRKSSVHYLKFKGEL